MQSLIIQLKKISLALVITQIAILPVAQAATIEVNNFGDINADDGACTLREAIDSANTNTAIGGCTLVASAGPEDIVTFTGVGAGQTILLTQAPALSIDSGEPLRIIGPGAGLLTIDGNKSIRTNSGIFYLSEVTAEIKDLTISNGARYQGGGVYAIDATTVYMVNTVVSGNMATLGNGGGIFAYGSDIFLTDSTVSGNSAETRWGGGIVANSSSNVTLTNSTVSGNVAFWAGGIMANSNSTVTLTNSTVSDNRAEVWGGGIIAQSDSTLDLDSSTVSGNWAYSIDNVSGHSGGGIVAGSGSTANLSNSTVSGNYAYQLGGGIAVNNSSLSLTNTTVSGNRARLEGAGISVRATDGNSSSASLSNSVIAYSTKSPTEDGTDCYESFEGTGTTSVTADDHNIIADGTCATSALNVDPMLDPLADNGGPTKTHKLLSGSPAIEAGDNAVCAAEPVNNLDQRGFIRPEGTNCDIGAFEFKSYSQGLTILKVVDGGTAVPADFTLHLTGGTTLGTTYDGTEEMKSGDTPDVEASTPYTLSETLLPGYAQADPGIACTDDDGGAVVDHPVTLSVNQNVTCTISNEYAGAPPLLTLIKTVVNNNGGDAESDDFLPTVDGTVVVSGEENAYFAGTPLVLNETLLPGYTFTSLTGTGCPTELGGTVTLASGDDITCTITNEDVAPQLTLIKTVIGGNAAPDDFKLTVDDDLVLSGVPNTYTANTILALNETQLQGYAFTSLTGDAKCPDVLPGSTLTLAPGDDITCTITNTAIAELTLIKTVVNDNGGTAAPDAFLPTVDGTVVVSGVKNAYIAGTLALNETQLQGYMFTSLTGTGCPSELGGTVTLEPGDDITCTITNDDVAPQLTLIKTVVNDNGGDAEPDDFLLTVGGTVVVSGEPNTYMANTTLALNETPLPGYTFTSLTGDAKCPDALGGSTLTLAPGDDITCTITNNDMQPGLTILKDVTNVKGGTGTAEPIDFTLHLEGGILGGTTYDGTEDMKHGDTPAVEANAQYTLSETEFPGYTMTGIRCTDDDGGAGVAHPVTLNEGQNVTCTISNSDDPDDSTYYVIPIPDGGVSVINL